MYKEQDAMKSLRFLISDDCYNWADIQSRLSFLSAENRASVQRVQMWLTPIEQIRENVRYGVHDIVTEQVLKHIRLKVGDFKQ